MLKTIKKLLNSSNYEDLLIALNLLDKIPLWKIKLYFWIWYPGQIICLKLKSTCLGPLIIPKLKGKRYYFCVLFQFPKEGLTQLWISKYPVIGKYEPL